MRYLLFLLLKSDMMTRFTSTQSDTQRVRHDIRFKYQVDNFGVSSNWICTFAVPLFNIPSAFAAP